VAAAQGHRSIVELLLNHGATQVDEAIKQASRNNHGYIIRWLYQRGRDRGQPIDLNSALVEAARHGFATLVTELIHLGATDVDRALVAAASRHNPHLLNILMSAGISLNGINRALSQAAAYGNLQTTQYLIEHGATDLAAAARIAMLNHQDRVANLIQSYQQPSH
jgi:ankyrin repeat protein